MAPRVSEITLIFFLVLMRGRVYFLLLLFLIESLIEFDGLSFGLFV